MIFYGTVTFYDTIKIYSLRMLLNPYRNHSKWTSPDASRWHRNVTALPGVMNDADSGDCNWTETSSIPKNIFKKKRRKNNINNDNKINFNIKLYLNNK